MSRKISKKRNKLADRIAQLLCVLLLFSAGGSLCAEEPPELWKFGSDAQPIGHVLKSQKRPKITRRENSVQNSKKKELSKKKFHRTAQQEDSLRMPNLAVPDVPRGAGTSKLKLKKERPKTSGLSVRAAEVLPQTGPIFGAHHVQKDNKTLGDAHLLLMGSGSEIRFRGVGKAKPRQAQPIPVLELPSEKPNLIVKKISHTIDEIAIPVEKERAVPVNQESAVAADTEGAAPIEVPMVERENEIVAIEFLRSVSPLMFGDKDNVESKARRTDKASRPKRIQGPFGYSR